MSHLFPCSSLNSNLFSINSLPITATIILLSCNNLINEKTDLIQDSTHSCMDVPSRFAPDSSSKSIHFNGDTTHHGMAYIPGGIFEMGGDNEQASVDCTLSFDVIQSQKLPWKMKEKIIKMFKDEKKKIQN